MHILKGADGQWARGVSEDIHGPVVFIAGHATAPVETSADVLDTLYFNVGSATSGGDASNTLSHVAAGISQLRMKGHATKNGLDPRLVDDTDSFSVARDDIGSDPTRSGVSNFFSPVRHRGAMRDNNWLAGWSWSSAVDLIDKADDNVARPSVTLTVATTTVSTSFAADTTETVAGDAVVYVVERSTDGKTFVPFVAVKDGGAGDTNGTAGQITVADSGYTFTGSPVHYRVIPQ